MILLVGGAYQGKEGAARRMAGERVQAAYGSRDPFSAAFKSDLVLELHEYIRRLCLEEAAESAIQGGTPDWAVNPNRTMGLDSQEAAKRRVMEFAGRLERENPNAIVTCDEVGCGIVPMDPNGRLWRELTGAALQYLAQRAEAVYRVSCGLLQPLKGAAPPVRAVSVSSVVRQKADNRPVSYGFERDAHGGDVYGERRIRLDFSININPLGMPAFVKEAVYRSVEACGAYPDIHCTRLRERIGAYYGIPGEQIIFGNGAAELIFLAARAVLPKRAVLFAPTFSEYETALQEAGTDLFFFPLLPSEGFHFSVERYLSFLQETDPQMIFLCSPSNPAGTVIPKGDLLRILEFCKKQGIRAVADECFLEFLDDPEEAGCLREVSFNPMLFLLRAPTKSFSMAGLRLGYGFSSDLRLLGRMRSMGQPWKVSIPAQAAGEAAFGPQREAFLEETRRLIKKERAYLKKGLEEAGFYVWDSAVNFLLFRDFKEAEQSKLQAFFRSQGILIRSCANYRGLDSSYYRVCVKRREENEEFLRVLSHYRG